MSKNLFLLSGILTLTPLSSWGSHQTNPSHPQVTAPFYSLLRNDSHASQNALEIDSFYGPSPSLTTSGASFVLDRQTDSDISAFTFANNVSPISSSLILQHFTSPVVVPSINFEPQLSSLTLQNPMFGPPPHSLTPPKTIRRGGIDLIPLDSDKQGLIDFYKKYKINISPNYYHDLLPPQDFHLYLSSTNTRDLYLFNPSPGEDLIKKEISSLSKAEIIILFKHLTDRLSYFKYEKELESFLNNAPARQIILEASQTGSQDLVLESISGAGSFSKKRSLIVGQPDLFSHLFDQDAFYTQTNQKKSLCLQLIEEFSIFSSSKNSQAIKDFLSHPRARAHLLDLPKDDNGHTPLVKMFFNAVYFNRPKRLDILFDEKEIVDHLASHQEKNGKDTLLTGLETLICLNKDETLPSFYKKPAVFSHLFSTIQKDDPMHNMFLQAGLVMSLLSRQKEEIESLLHPEILSFLKDRDLIGRILDNAIEERNVHLWRILIQENDFCVTPTTLLKGAQVPCLWHSLAPEHQERVLNKLQDFFPEHTRALLESGHEKILTYEHAMTRHPLTLKKAQEQSDVFVSSTYKEKDLFPAGPNSLDIKRQQLHLQHTFAKHLLENPARSAPWLHTNAVAAYDKGALGQEVKVLVVELNKIHLPHKQGLLDNQLDPQTHYTKKAFNKGSRHNIGITSLVAHMAPLAQILSTTTRKIDTLSDKY